MGIAKAFRPSLSALLPYVFVVIDVEHGDEVFYWCFDHFGTHGGPLPQRYYVTSDLQFMFADHADATAFKLRWC